MGDLKRSFRSKFLGAAFFPKRLRGQTAVEYVLLIGSAVIFFAIVAYIIKVKVLAGG